MYVAALRSLTTTHSVRPATPFPPLGVVEPLAASGNGRGHFFDLGVEEQKQAPMCFWSQRQFALWKAADHCVPEKARCDSNPCPDCLPQFQLRMKKLGRCEHPEVMFGIDEGSVFGYAPDLSKLQQVGA